MRERGVYINNRKKTKTQKKTSNRNTKEQTIEYKGRIHGKRLEEKEEACDKPSPWCCHGFLAPPPSSAGLCVSADFELGSKMCCFH